MSNLEIGDIIRIKDLEKSIEILRKRHKFAYTVYEAKIIDFKTLYGYTEAVIVQKLSKVELNLKTNEYEIKPFYSALDYPNTTTYLLKDIEDKYTVINRQIIVYPDE